MGRKILPVGDIEFFQAQFRFGDSRENWIDVAVETAKVNLSEPGESSEEIGKKGKRGPGNREGGDEVVGDGEEKLADQRQRREPVAVVDEIEDQFPAFLRQIHEL